MVATRNWPVMRAIVPVCSVLRLKSFSVVSPCITPRKCAPRNCMSANWRRAKAPAAMPISAMKSGMSGAVTSRMTKVSASSGTTTIRMSSGTRTAPTAPGR